MKHPLVLALGAGLLVLLVAFAAPLLYIGRGAAPPPPEQGLPWQVSVRADGALQVFGLAIGADRLADAQERIGDGLQVALVARLGEAASLEALADPFAAGFVSGRLVLAFDVPASTLARWHDNAPRSEAMEGGVRRFELQAADRDEALRATIAGLTFVPTLRLAEADVRQRFGAPASELALASDAKLLLYPQRGMTAAVGAGGRGVLQYVAPRDFEARLRAPLAAFSASAAGLSPVSGSK
jgi:hypothetical protein